MKPLYFTATPEDEARAAQFALSPQEESAWQAVAEAEHHMHLAERARRASGGTDREKEDNDNFEAACRAYDEAIKRAHKLAGVE